MRSGIWDAAVLPSEIRERGYTGGYTILEDWLQPERGAARAVATRRFVPATEWALPKRTNCSSVSTAADADRAAHPEGEPGIGAADADRLRPSALTAHGSD